MSDDRKESATIPALLTGLAANLIVILTDVFHFNIGRGNCVAEGPLRSCLPNR